MKTDDLIQLLARQPAALPRPRLAPEWWLASLAGLAAAIVLMLLVLGPRSGLAAAWASPLFWHKLGVVAGFALLSGAIAYRSALPGRRAGSLSNLRWGIVGWLLVATIAVFASAPEGRAWAQFNSSTILVCLASIPLLALPTAVALIAVLRRGAPTDPAGAARAVGCAAGAVGAFAYAFHCPQDAPGYLLVWYGLALAITVGLVRATATRWLRW